MRLWMLVKYEGDDEYTLVVEGERMDENEPNEWDYSKVIDPARKVVDVSVTVTP